MTTQTPRAKPLPVPTPETQPYWDGCKAHELRLQYCLDCQAFFFYPRIFCPRCLGDQLEWRPVSGRGTLHTYVINQLPAPGFEADVPYVIAIVALSEGPHLMSTIVGVAPTPANLPAGLPLEVVFQDVSETIALPQFQPAGAAKGGA